MIFSRFWACSLKALALNTPSVGSWPSGRATLFGSADRRFESYRPSQLHSLIGSLAPLGCFRHKMPPIMPLHRVPPQVSLNMEIIWLWWAAGGPRAGISIAQQRPAFAASANHPDQPDPHPVSRYFTCARFGQTTELKRTLI